MSVTGASPAGDAARSPAAFNLLDNPFEFLGCTPNATLAELTEAASGFGTTPQAATALRTLSIPRTRLAAELGFLPGVEAVAPVLAPLYTRERPVPDLLPPAARANLLAHLCAAGLAQDGDLQALAECQPPPGDTALIAALDAARDVAGMPHVQPGALPAEQEALADRHAAALVAACVVQPEPAASLATVVRAVPAGPPSAFLRRATASWARQSASSLAKAEEAAQAAAARLTRSPTGETAEAFSDAAGAWAALSLPQRLSDARAGLDHPPSVRVLRGWRATVARLVEERHAGLGIPLAEFLATTFADLPGESIRLREDIAAHTATYEEHELAERLAPLRALCDRLGKDTMPLLVSLAGRPFGPKSKGVSAELWAVFDAACLACAGSEAPWTIMRGLVDRLGGALPSVGSAGALVLHRGLAARAQTAGRETLAARLRAEERGLERAIRLWKYQDIKARSRQFGHRFLVFGTLAALRHALKLVDDPVQRTALSAEARTLKRTIVATLATFGFIIAGGAALLSVGLLDEHYSDNAPYRNRPAQAVAPMPGAQPPPLAAVPPAPAPIPFIPPAIPPMTSPETPQDAPPPKFAGQDVRPYVHPVFPVHTVLPERRPGPGPAIRSLPEIRWCLFNEVRLASALDAASSPDETDGVTALRQEWAAGCDDYRARRRDADQAAAERDRTHTRLETEGHDMIRGAAKP